MQRLTLKRISFSDRVEWYRSGKAILSYIVKLWMSACFWNTNPIRRRALTSSSLFSRPIFFPSQNTPPACGLSNQAHRCSSVLFPHPLLPPIINASRTLAAELTARHHPVSHTKVTQLLREDGYSLQGNRKTEEGGDHPDRDAQFRYINRAVKQALRAGEPVISVDTKKKELIGNYQNQGRQWRQTGTADKVNGHDFPGPEVPRAYPYGIYDLGRNAGFVNVGTDHDTGAFAVASIRGWWRAEGRRLYPRVRQLLITADGGGSNGWRLRLWKWELQGLADQTGLTLAVCHFPPGTSKWNKVEHRLFSFISSNWRGEPLRDYETVVRLIAGTTTAKGLTVTCRLDHRKYPVGRRITDEEFAHVNLKPDKFHGEWNYTILPRN